MDCYLLIHRTVTAPAHVYHHIRRRTIGHLIHTHYVPVRAARRLWQASIFCVATIGSIAALHYMPPGVVPIGETPWPGAMIQQVPAEGPAGGGGEASSSPGAATSPASSVTLPEPSSAAIFGLATLGVIAIRRRK